MRGQLVPERRKEKGRERDREEPERVVDKCLQFIWLLLKCLTNLLGDFVEHLRCDCSCCSCHYRTLSSALSLSLSFCCLAGIMLIRILHFNKFSYWQKSHTGLLSPELCACKRNRWRKRKENFLTLPLLHSSHLSLSLSQSLLPSLSLNWHYKRWLPSVAFADLLYSFAFVSFAASPNSMQSAGRERERFHIKFRSITLGASQHFSLCGISWPAN